MEYVYAIINHSLIHSYYFGGEKKRKSETRGKRRIVRVNKWRSGGIKESKTTETKMGYTNNMREVNSERFPHTYLE